MFEYFGLKYSSIIGTPFGYNFCCKGYRYTCGGNDNCKYCEINAAIQSLWRDGIQTKEKIIQFTFHHGKCRGLKWLQLHTGWITYGDTHYIILTFTDITHFKQNERRLEVRLSLDPATGILNKTSLLHSMRRLMIDKRNYKVCTLCMVDFDNFKSLNDQYGHLFGDHVLKTFSNIARKYIRKNDILGRFGGEEFIFLFKDTDEKQSLKILERIHKELEDCFSSYAVFVTFSAGVTYISNENCVFTQLMDEVDQKLYQAKKKGRGRAISNMGETLFTESLG